MRPRSLVVPLAVVMGAAPAARYDEPLRPRFHFTPARNFMNDPNGLVFHAGEYHLFYEHNPFGEKWGHMSWGHAVSPDMLHWKHLPVAIGEEGLDRLEVRPGTGGAMGPVRLWELRSVWK